MDAVFFVKRSSNLMERQPGEKSMRVPVALGTFVPRGWFEANAASIVDLNLDYLVRPLRDRGWQDAIAERRRLEELLKGMKSGSQYGWVLDKFFASMMLPIYLRIVDRAAYGECLLDQAIIACALERYRIENGSYPNALTDLSRPGEKSLPLDIFSGKPMSYHKTDDGRYLLWAVGFDGVDDDGMRPTKKGGWNRPNHIEYQGDWVLDFPTREEVRAASETPTLKPKEKSKRTRPKPGPVPVNPEPSDTSPQN